MVKAKAKAKAPPADEVDVEYDDYDSSEEGEFFDILADLPENVTKPDIVKLLKEQEGWWKTTGTKDELLNRLADARLYGMIREMSEKELKTELKEFGLITTGEKEELVDRYKRYVTRPDDGLYEVLPVEELKEFCEEYKLLTTGVKSAMVDRIKAHILVRINKGLEAMTSKMKREEEKDSVMFEKIMAEMMKEQNEITKRQAKEEKAKKAKMAKKAPVKKAAPKKSASKKAPAKKAATKKKVAPKKKAAKKVKK